MKQLESDLRDHLISTLQDNPNLDLDGLMKIGSGFMANDMLSGGYAQRMAAKAPDAVVSSAAGAGDVRGYDEASEGDARSGQQQDEVTGSRPDSQTHVMREGDTLWSISQQRGIPLEEIQAANPQITDPTKIPIGAEINIPAGKGVAVGSASAGGAQVQGGAANGQDALQAEVKPATQRSINGQASVNTTNTILTRFDDYLTQGNAPIEPESNGARSLAEFKDFARITMHGMIMQNPKIDSGTLFGRILSMWIKWQAAGRMSGNESGDAPPLPPEFADAYAQGMKLDQKVQAFMGEVPDILEGYGIHANPEPDSDEAAKQAALYANVRDAVAARYMQNPNEDPRALRALTLLEFGNWVQGPDSPYKEQPPAPEVYGESMPLDVELDDKKYFLVGQTITQLCGGNQECEQLSVMDPARLGAVEVKVNGKKVYLQKGWGDNDAFLHKTNEMRYDKISNYAGVGAKAALVVPGLGEPAAAVLELVSKGAGLLAFIESDEKAQRLVGTILGKGAGKAVKSIVSDMGLPEKVGKRIERIAESRVDDAVKKGTDMMMINSPNSEQNEWNRSERERRAARNSDVKRFPTFFRKLPFGENIGQLK